MRDLLKGYFGFTNEEIRVVADFRATKGNIMYRLDEMATAAKAGDTLIFHFSGHGSQIRDRDGDELKDHMDEVLCPYDCGWDSNFIVDDELRVILNKVPSGVHIEVLLDCCFAGTGTKAMSKGLPQLPDGPKQRFAAPPLDIVFRSDGDEDDLPLIRIKGKPTETNANHILWASCKESQYAADGFLSGAYHGAFTFWFCRHIRRAGGGISRATLLTRIRNSLKRYGYDQTPQLESDKAETKELVFQD
jgi:hypothetical protein